MADTHQELVTDLMYICNRDYSQMHLLYINSHHYNHDNLDSRMGGTKVIGEDMKVSTNKPVQYLR